MHRLRHLKFLVHSAESEFGATLHNNLGRNVQTKKFVQCVDAVCCRIGECVIIKNRVSLALRPPLHAPYQDFASAVLNKGERDAGVWLLFLISGNNCLITLCKSAGCSHISFLKMNGRPQKILSFSRNCEGQVIIP
jgi:hypothetical protein